MAYIEIYNDYNTILIDDNALNPRLLTRGVASSSSVVAMESVVQIPVTSDMNNGSMPLVAVAPRTAGVFVSLHQVQPVSGNNYNWIYAQSLGNGVAGTFDTYQFQDGLTAPLAGTGLVVCRNAQGVVVFDSDASYANMVDVVSVPLDTSLTKVYKSGRKYAVCNSLPLVKRSSAPVGGGWINVYPIGAAISNNVIQFAHYKARDPQNTGFQGTAVGNTIAATFMVFDVTGL